MAGTFLRFFVAFARALQSAVDVNAILCTCVRLPATTIASCLPLSARSLLGSSLLCAIRVSGASDAETGSSQTARGAQQSFGTPGVHGGDRTGAGTGEKKATHL